MIRIVPALALALTTTLVPLGAFAAYRMHATPDTAAQEVAVQDAPPPATPATPDNAAPQNVAENYRGRQELRHDERRVGQDRRDIVRDERAIGRDRAWGDWRDAARARADLRRDERDLHRDRRDVAWDEHR